ncbi:hypothetical protein TI39_contig4426g00002 [Zymoseptoria brevis]|uniref:Glycosyltransferase family 32 protein n=1 Tax=Zymoseptoria brevis TaxID=1047168 RepID=A0A0F4G6R7_9PEZI|nr:hypothetical protein TI39_contig4426g00002 [Zymoseptoria brevis]
MHYSTTVRITRYLVALLISIALVRLCILALDRGRFQRHLHTRYITWDSFPSQYAETLRSKDWAGLATDTFDYARWFPSSQSSIPRAIHFIWFKDLYDARPETQIPASGSEAPELCREHNPSYNITIWNAQSGRQLIEDNYDWFLPTYDAYKYPIQRIDALKYFVLWHHGGVYMDLDITCRRPLDPLLNVPAWFPEASPLGLNNDLMASRAGHPILELMLRSLEWRSRWNLLFPYLTIFWSTGPQFTGDMVQKWFERHPVFSNSTSSEPPSNDWFVLPQVFYSEEYTFFGHSPGGTWHGQDVATVLWFVAHPVVFWVLVIATLVGFCVAPRLWKQRKIRLRHAENQWKEFEG